MFRPGRTGTRHIIAAQLLSVGLLMHLTGGRVETHFHVFESLAFLDFFRDWRVLLTATANSAADNLVRGFAWPESVYGTPLGAEWRWVEHAWWEVFIDLFLFYWCWQANADSRREAEREAAHATIDQRVADRTASASSRRSRDCTTGCGSWRRPSAR